jgi:hypothetical protein
MYGATEVPLLGVVEDGIGHGLCSFGSSVSGTILAVPALDKVDRAMPTPNECRQHAEECLKLAKETPQIYARQALLELAAEFQQIAEELERRGSHFTGAKRRRAHNNFAPPRHRRA